MSTVALKAALAVHLRGLYAIPDDIEATPGDCAWFAERGRIFRGPFVQWPVPGEDGACWYNAAKAMWADQSLRYMQGLVQGPFTHELVAHAWCIDRNDRVVETTWDVTKSTGFEKYFGVVFTLDDLCVLQNATGRYAWYTGFADILTGERRRTAADSLAPSVRVRLGRTDAAKNSRERTR